MVDYTKRPRYPEVAWGGNRLAIVYDDYYSSASSSGVYLLLADIDGNVVYGPEKLSTHIYAVHPKIVWTGSSFGIIYAAADARYNMIHYLERYDTAGTRLSHNKLTGVCYSDDPLYSRLIWMGNKFGIFYYARTLEEDYRFMLYVTADSSGYPGYIKKMYPYYPLETSIHWTGKTFIILNGGALQSYDPDGIAQLLIMKKHGKIVAKKTVTFDVDPVWSCDGVSLIPLQATNTYLTVLSGDYYQKGIPSPCPPGLYTPRSDYYSAVVKARNKKIDDFSLSNGTGSHGAEWCNPQGLAANGRYFIAGGHGTGIVFLEVDAQGRIVGNPLYDTPHG